MPKIDILGFSHFYELTPPTCSDTSPVLVFIHGWLLGKSYWQPLVQKLNLNYRCLTYDMRGFGESQPSENNETEQKNHYTLESYARDLQILLNKLEIKQAWLIGHSLGGILALTMAQLEPKIITGVICLNTGGGIYLKEEFERFRLIGEKLVRMRPTWLLKCPLLDLVFSHTMVHRPLARQWGKQRVIDFVRADSKAALGSLMNSTTEEEVHLLPQLVAQLEQPVYFIAGDKDIVMETKYVRHLASFHWLFKETGSNVIEINDCGHIAMLEQTDVIESHIRRLLKKHTI